MASKKSSSLALFLALNLLFFAIGGNANNCNSCPTPSPGQNPSPVGNPPPSVPTPSNPGTGNGTSNGTCPRDALQIGVCVNVLNGLLNLTIGQPPVQPCCTLIQGLADIEAAACLCTAIRASILGITLNIPIALSLLLNVCGNQVPSNFQCA